MRVVVVAVGIDVTDAIPKAMEETKCERRMGDLHRATDTQISRVLNASIRPIMKSNDRRRPKTNVSENSNFEHKGRENVAKNDDRGNEEKKIADFSVTIEGCAINTEERVEQNGSNEYGALDETDTRKERLGWFIGQSGIECDPLEKE